MQVIGDLREYVAKLAAEGYAGKYVANQLTAFLTWLNINGVDISRKSLGAGAWSYTGRVRV